MTRTLTQWLRGKFGASKPRRMTERFRPNLVNMEDRWVPAQLFTVTNEAQLVSAINSSNDDAAGGFTDASTGNLDVIQFSGISTIKLSAALPASTGYLAIDGSTQLSGVTIDGNGFTAFTNDNTLEIDGSVSLIGDLDLGGFAVLNNTGTLSVTGDVSMADQAGVNDNGNASLSVTGNITGGQFGYIQNGVADSDVSSVTVGGSLSLGDFGFVNNTGNSKIGVTRDLSLGNGSFLQNGTAGTVSAGVTVGGNLNLGTGGSVDNYTGSTISVTGNVTLGNNGSLNNGHTDADSATFSVGGNFVIGDSSAGGSDSGTVNNFGSSKFTVNGGFTIFGDGGSQVTNGGSSSNAAAFSVGNFSLGNGGSVTDYGTFAVNKTTAGPASFEVLSGGLLEVTNGASFTVLAKDNLTVDDGGTLKVDTGGTLTVGTGGAVTFAGTVTVDGTVNLPSLVVSGSGNTRINGQVTIASNLDVTNTAIVDVYGQLTVNTLTLEQSGQLVQEPGSQVQILNQNQNQSKQSITFGALTHKTYGDAAFTVSAGASSGLPVTFTIVSGGAYASISGNTVTILGATPAGTVVTVEANQAGNASFKAAKAVDRTFTIGKADQTITVTTLPPSSAVFGTSFLVGATSNSGLPVTVAASGAGSYNAATGQVTMTNGTGKVSVTFTQAGDANHKAATKVVTSVTAQKADQTISFGGLANKMFGDPDFTLAGTSSSGLAVTYTISGNATLSGNTVHITGVGPVTVTAHQKGNTNYNAAGNVAQSFAIADQMVVVNSANPSYTYTDTNGGQITVNFNGVGSATLTLEPSGRAGRMKVISLAVTGTTNASDLTVSVPTGATTSIGSISIAGSGMHNVNLANVTVAGFNSGVAMNNLTVGDVTGTFQATAGGNDVTLGKISAAVTLSGGFHNVTLGNVVGSFTLLNTANNVTFGNVNAGGTVNLGTSTQAGSILGFTGGNIVGSLFVYDTFQNGAVGTISGHVFLQSIGHQFTTTSNVKKGTWTANDLVFANGGDILLGTIGDKSKILSA